MVFWLIINNTGRYEHNIYTNPEFDRLYILLQRVRVYEYYNLYRKIYF